MTNKTRHEIKIQSFADQNGQWRGAAMCMTHAVGTPATTYRGMDMWIQAHRHATCAGCGHAASSHGYGLASWEYGNTGCGTCKGPAACTRYRG